MELSDVTAKLPEGMDTPLGKVKSNGIDISVGEWQRIAIIEKGTHNELMDISGIYSQMYESQRRWYQ